MSALRHTKLLAAWAACWSLASLAGAQVEHCPPCCEHDFQWFEPVALDLDCTPDTPDCGLFFHYDKQYGTISGERTALGVRDLNQPFVTGSRVFQTGIATQVIPDPDDPTEFTVIILRGEDVILEPGVVGATIRDAGPKAEFGWGDRYELGFGDKEGGWLLGVQDGIDQTQGDVYGFGDINPLGGVYIPFLDPQFLMTGFVDINGDGIADDLDGDGQFGPDGVDTDDTPGPDTNVPGFPPDFDDLASQPTTWQTVAVSSHTTVDGVEINKFHNLKNDHMMAKHQHNQFRLMYGVRFIRLRDQYNVDAFGGTLGDSFWHTQIDNNLVGPQLGLSWFHTRQKFRFELNSRFMAAYNIGNWDQTAALGSGLQNNVTPYNTPILWNNTYSTHGRQTEDFSPLAELRAQLSYQVTTAISAKLGYTATYMGNIHRAAPSIRYELPTMGFLDGSGENAVINALNFGVDVVY